jgi:predicted alpha-1,2-mannosidase
MLGKALGKPEEEIAPYRHRAMNYRNLFDSETHLMRGRNADGTFQSPFNPLKWGDAFTEGNSLHYTWSVFHDPAGLIALMGGAREFNDALDGVFNIPPLFDDSYYGFTIHEIREMQIMNMGNYAHGNQPIQHMIYLYDWSGEPWKTQYRVRQVMDRLYSATPDGYCGDEDNGQTSAWYVFSALGFYPVCPGSGQYAIGSPLFRRVVVRPSGASGVSGSSDASGASGSLGVSGSSGSGRVIEISTRGGGENAPYIASMSINGRAVSRNYLTHEELTGTRADGSRDDGTGADGTRGDGIIKIAFEMSPTPDTSRGTTPTDAPYSFSRE